MIQGLGLSSGGLDSILAALVLKKQGVCVEQIAFETPFFSAEKAQKAAEITGIPLIVMDITEEYLPMLKNPACGYGKNMNPCMDCHALMFRIAGRVMKEKGFHFLFSGEVLGQRPMSQTKSSLRYVEKHSCHDGYIIRPLSAKKLPESIPEQKGWINRERLLDLSGRSRKPQMELAHTMGITDYPAPAGGCLLTEAVFSERLKDLFAHQDNPDKKDLFLLSAGRHFRIAQDVKVIAGRTQKDNAYLDEHSDPGLHIRMKTQGVPGPLLLYAGPPKEEYLRIAATICASYAKSPKTAESSDKSSVPCASSLWVQVAASGRGVETTFRVKALSPKEFKSYLI